MPFFRSHLRAKLIAQVLLPLQAGVALAYRQNQVVEARDPLKA